MKYFLILIILLFIWSFFIEPNLLVVKNYTFKELGDKKIVFVSDFHIAKNERKRLQKIVNTINEIEPDLVLSGGDFIKGHDGKYTLPIEEQVKEFKKIKAPMITVLGMSLQSLVSGAIITEQVFAWPGIGQLAVTAVMQYDYPLIMGITMFTALLVVLGNLLADVLYAVFDPRIRKAGC